MVTLETSGCGYCQKFYPPYPYTITVVSNHYLQLYIVKFSSIRTSHHLPPSTPQWHPNHAPMKLTSNITDYTCAPPPCLAPDYSLALRFPPTFTNLLSGTNHVHECGVADLYPLDNYFESWQGNCILLIIGFIMDSFNFGNYWVGGLTYYFMYISSCEYIRSNKQRDILVDIWLRKRGALHLLPPYAFIAWIAKKWDRGNRII